MATLSVAVRDLGGGRRAPNPRRGMVLMTDASRGTPLYACGEPMALLRL
jgi:hypothetical protein